MIDWNELALVFIGGLLGVTGTISTFFLQRRHDRVRILSDKLEELYLCSEQYISVLRTVLLNQELVMVGRLTLEQASDLVTKQLKSDSGTVQPYVKVRTIVSLFFPQLQKSLLSLYEARGKCINCYIRFERDYKEIGPHQARGLDEYRHAQVVFENAVEEFMQGVVDESRKITGVKSKYSSMGDEL